MPACPVNPCGRVVRLDHVMCRYHWDQVPEAAQRAYYAERQTDPRPLGTIEANRAGAAAQAAIQAAQASETPGNPDGSDA